MASPLASSLSPILTAVKTEVVSVTGLSSTMVHLLARPTTPKFRGDRDVLLRPGQVSWDRGFDGGSGRVCAIIRRPLLVTIRTRLATDLSDDDTDRLTDPALGHIVLEESVANALLDFMPQDSNQNLLVQEPMHPIDYPPEETENEPITGFIMSRMAFQLTYQLPLSQSIG